MIFDVEAGLATRLRLGAHYDLGGKGVTVKRRDNAQSVRALGDEAAGNGVGTIAEALHHLEDALAGSGRDFGLAIDHTRHRLRGDACGGRHVLNGDWFERGATLSHIVWPYPSPG